ncbi:MAG: phosphoserine phosphatase [Chloroflexota bacterium]|nr:phosphoserine phosphatase [Chloroflexota bacterium]
MAKLFESPAEEIARLIFVRHGRTTRNTESRIGARDDSELDEIGLQQAQAVAQRLHDFPVSRVYTSPIRRAHHTAETIATELALPLVEQPDLTEYDFGLIGGMNLPEISQKYPEIYADLQDWIHMKSDPDRARPVIPGEETFDALAERTQRFMAMVAEEHKGETVVAVTHLGVIKACVTPIFGGSVQKPMNFIAFNTSLTVIDFLRKRPILMAFNDTRHMDHPLSYGNITIF